jgi:hypothetical protein
MSLPPMPEITLPLHFQFCLEQKLDLQVLALWATNTYLGIGYHYLPTAHSRVTCHNP